MIMLADNPPLTHMIAAVEVDECICVINTLLVCLFDAQWLGSMHTAALHGHLDVLRMLLDAGGSSSLVDNGGGQPIHEAAAGGHVECLELLHSRGADPSSCDACGCTPLHRAASAGHSEAARWLLKVFPVLKSESNEKVVLMCVEL